MSGWHWFVVGYLILSGLIVFGRGCAGKTRQYSIIDAVLTVPEIAFLVWVVAVKL